MSPEEISAQAFAKELSEQSINFYTKCIESWEEIKFSLSEPALVETYLLGAGVGVDYLNTHFAKQFSSASDRFEIKFASVFIHGRPKVYRHLGTTLNPHSTSCEIGDICLIYVHVDKQKNIRHAKSIIAQAKKSKALDSEDQRLLYDEAGGFNYKTESFYKNTFNGEPLRALPGYFDGRALGLKFLILSPCQGKDPGTRAVLNSLPWASDLHHTWGASLFRMATGCDGLEFDPGNPKSSHWSAILDDLIRMGRGAIPSSSKTPTRRGKVNELDEIVDKFNHFTDYDKWNIRGENDVPEGISLMLMIVQDTELEADQ